MVPCKIEKDTPSTHNEVALSDLAMALRMAFLSVIILPVAHVVDQKLPKSTLQLFLSVRTVRFG